eukprot:765496-Hanusia_phi.AAC.3
MVYLRLGREETPPPFCAYIPLFLPLLPPLFPFYHPFISPPCPLAHPLPCRKANEEKKRIRTTDGGYSVGKERGNSWWLKLNGGGGSYEHIITPHFPHKYSTPSTLHRILPPILSYPLQAHRYPIKDPHPLTECEQNGWFHPGSNTLWCPPTPTPNPVAKQFLDQARLAQNDRTSDRTVPSRARLTPYCSESAEALRPGPDGLLVKPGLGWQGTARHLLS